MVHATEEVGRLREAAAEVSRLVRQLTSARPGPPITSQERRRLAADAEVVLAALAVACDQIERSITDQGEHRDSDVDIGTSGDDALRAVALRQDDLDRARDGLQESVEAARTQGASWRQIGGALGIAGQTAHKRFDPKARRRHADNMRRRYQRLRTH